MAYSIYSINNFRTFCLSLITKLEFDNDVIDDIYVQLSDLYVSKNYSEVIVNDLTEKMFKNHSG
jgi:hypothetical protein